MKKRDFLFFKRNTGFKKPDKLLSITILIFYVVSVIESLRMLIIYVDMNGMEC